jgi:hypothetical protein
MLERNLGHAARQVKLPAGTDPAELYAVHGTASLDFYLNRDRSLVPGVPSSGNDLDREL